MAAAEAVEPGPGEETNRVGGKPALGHTIVS